MRDVSLESLQCGCLLQTILAYMTLACLMECHGTGVSSPRIHSQTLVAFGYDIVENFSTSIFLHYNGNLMIQNGIVVDLLWKMEMFPMWSFVREWAP